MNGIRTSLMAVAALVLAATGRAADDAADIRLFLAAYDSAFVAKDLERLGAFYVTSEYRVAVEFRLGLATDRPLGRDSFDCIVSSLLFHLLPADKQRALRKALDLLKAGGELHVAGWGWPHDPLRRAAFPSVQLLDGFATTDDSVRGLLPGYTEKAGFEPVSETYRERTGFGTLAL